MLFLAPALLVACAGESSSTVAPATHTVTTPSLTVTDTTMVLTTTTVTTTITTTVTTAVDGTPIVTEAPPPYQLPKKGGYFDYQLGGDYPPPADVLVVARDWFAGGVPVLRRDRNLVTPDEPGYEFETFCGFRGYG